MTKKEAPAATEKKSSSTRKGGGGRSSPRQQQQQQRERPPTPVATTATGEERQGGRSSPHYDGSGAAAAAATTAGSGPGGTARQTSSSQASRGRGRGSERSKGYPKSRRRPPAGRRSSGGRGSGGSSSTVQEQDQNIAEASDTISTSGSKSRTDETKQQQQQSKDGADLSQVLQVKVEEMERQNKMLQEQMEQHFKATKSEVDGLRAELRAEKKRCSRLNKELKSSREETLAIISSKTVLSNRVRELERQLNSIATGGGGGSRSGSRSPRTNRVIDLERQLEEAVRTISNLRLQQSHQESSPSTLSSSGNGGGDIGSKGSDNSNTQSNLNRSGDTDANTIGASERLDRAHQQIVILEAERKAEQERNRGLEQRLADLQSNFDRLAYYQQGRKGYQEGTTPAGKGEKQYAAEGATTALKNEDSPPPITGQQLMELQAAFDRQIQLKPKTTIENPLHPGNESRSSAWDDTEVDPGIDRKIQVVKGDDATDTQPFSKEDTGFPRVQVLHAPKEGSRDESATESGDETTPFCVLVRGIPPSTTPADVHKFLILRGVTDISYIKLTTVDDAPETQGQGNVFITTEKGCTKAMSLTGQQMRGHSLHVSPANIRTQSLFEGQSAPSTLPFPHQQQPMEAQQTHHRQGQQRSPYIPQEPEDAGHGGPLGTYCIYFRGAPYRNTPEEVYDFFVSHGVTDIQSFEVKRDDRTGGTSGDGIFYVKTKEGYEHVLSLHKKIFLGNRYIEFFDGSNQYRSSSGSRPTRTDDGEREGRRPSGGVYGNRRDRFSSGNRRTNTSGRRMHQPAGFYNQQNFAMGGQGLTPNHPQALYEGNMYGNPHGQHQQPYGQHEQEYHQQQHQHLHFQHHEGFQGIHPPAPMYGFVAPGYDLHGGNVYPSPQFNPDTTGGGGGWHGGDMGGNVGGAPQEAVLFPTIDLGVPASQPWSTQTPSAGQEQGQHSQQQYPVQESIGGPTFDQPPRLETGINVIPPPPRLLEDDDDDDPPDLINEDSLPSFDQKEDMPYSNIGRDTHSDSAASGGSVDSARDL